MFLSKTRGFPSARDLGVSGSTELAEVSVERSGRGLSLPALYQPGTGPPGRHGFDPFDFAQGKH